MDDLEEPSESSSQRRDYWKRISWPYSDGATDGKQSGAHVLGRERTTGRYDACCGGPGGGADDTGNRPVGDVGYMEAESARRDGEIELRLEIRSVDEAVRQKRRICMKTERK